MSCHLDLGGDLESRVSLSPSSPTATAPSWALAYGSPAGMKKPGHLSGAASSSLACSPAVTGRLRLFTSKHLAHIVLPFHSLLNFISHYFSHFGFHPKTPPVSSPAAPLLINAHLSIIPYEQIQRNSLSWSSVQTKPLGLKSPSCVS